jgi:hypothetical protein
MGLSWLGAWLERGDALACASSVGITMEAARRWVSLVRPIGIGSIEPIHRRMLRLGNPVPGMAKDNGDCRGFQHLI